MIRVWWDGSVLRVRGTTKAGRIALLGKEHDQGDLVLGREEIAEVRFKAPGLFTNGNLVLRDANRRKYQLHFRRKQRAQFERLARELGAAV